MSPPLVPMPPQPDGHAGRYPQAAGAGWLLVPGKGALFAPRTIPLAFPSLGHFDDAVAQAHSRMRKVEGLNAATVKWTGNAYKMFRRFLQSAAQHRERFLGGDLEAQHRILEAWVAWLRDGNRSSVTINNYWRGLSLIIARINRERGW